LLTPLIESRVTGISGGSGADGDDSQRTIQMRGADVKLTVKATTLERDGVYQTSSTERALSPFSVLFSGSIPPGGSANVGFEVITPAQMRDIVTTSGVDVAGGQSLTAEVLAEVTIRGTLGGDEITSSAFYYPISVCTDCVVINLGTCPAVGTVPQGNACNIYQDGTVGCCTDASNNLVCPATTM
jgi:hypothetical protein